MCGRFVQALSPEKIVQFFGAEPESVARAVAAGPNYNVAPSQEVIDVVPAEAEGNGGAGPVPGSHADGRLARRVRWGMIMPWASSPDEGPRPINARAESVASKPAFKAAFAARRSVVPADGFYEWARREGGRKVPYFIRDASGDPLAIAAIWSEWHGPGGESSITTCALITVPAAPGLAEIHDRMPALLRPEDFDTWLDPSNRDREGLVEMLMSTSGDGLEWYPVSRRVNSPSENDAALIEPVGQSGWQDPRSADHQHRAVSVVDHPVGYGPQQEPLESPGSP